MKAGRKAGREAGRSGGEEAKGRGKEGREKESLGGGACA